MKPFLYRLIYGPFEVNEQLNGLVIEERQDLRQEHARDFLGRFDPEERIRQPCPPQAPGGPSLRSLSGVEPQGVRRRPPGELLQSGLAFQFFPISLLPGFLSRLFSSGGC
jgi:hypothetical protein